MVEASFCNVEGRRRRYGGLKVQECIKDMTEPAVTVIVKFLSGSEEAKKSRPFPVEGGPFSEWLPLIVKMKHTRLSLGNYMHSRSFALLLVIGKFFENFKKLEDSKSYFPPSIVC